MCMCSIITNNNTTTTTNHDDDDDIKLYLFGLDPDLG